MESELFSKLNDVLNDNHRDKLYDYFVTLGNNTRDKITLDRLMTVLNTNYTGVEYVAKILLIEGVLEKRFRLLCYDCGEPIEDVNSHAEIKEIDAYICPFCDYESVSDSNYNTENNTYGIVFKLADDYFYN